MQQLKINVEKVIWVHCASLGEFEQGRPVIERLRTTYPKYKIIITFFSPSGYEVRKNYAGADYIFYLPMDSASDAQKFFDAVNPTLILFIKYEFWNFYLQEAKKRNIPLLLVSAIFRKDQFFFSRFGGFYRNMLKCFTHIFVQNQESFSLLSTIQLKNASVSGDTRFDRVIEIAEQFEPIAAIEKFCGSSLVVVAGSTWTEDDKELDHFANTHPDVKFIIAPHNITSSRINECRHLYKKTVLFSELNETTDTAAINTLIINNVGMLSRLYKYASICFIGGGFGEEGIHNVLEAAVYGKPVIFGPVYEKYMEAVELVENGGAISVENTLELEKELNALLQNPDSITTIGNIARNYVYDNKGATDAILHYIQENRLLTS